MNRRHPSTLRSAAIAAADMSHRPNPRGNRSHGRRDYCDNPRPEFLASDTHFSAVRGENRGFRPNYNDVPPPPPQFYNAQRFQCPPAGPSYPPQFPGPGPYGYQHHPGPVFGSNQQFRPQQMQQQFRPRLSKPPDYREWECAALVPPPDCERFTVLSYNILADYLANDHWQQLYFHIPRYMLDWNWRRRSLCFELGLWSADIMCFQEVDRFQDIEAEMKQRGYNGIWKMRTGDPVDGCAIFWRVSRFKLLHEESIEYNKLGLRDNVAQICVFESLNGQNNSNGTSSLSSSSTNHQRVVVCNIHVLFNPKRGDIKLGQIRVLLDRANAVSKLWDDAPVVLCGDFNCTPDSPMYNYITKQKLDLSELPRNRVSGQVSAEIRPPSPNALPYFRTQSADFSISNESLNGPRVENASPNPSVRVVSDKIVSSEPPSEDLLSMSNDDKVCVESNLETVSVADVALEEDFERLSVNESVDGTKGENQEDCDSFLSRLHSTGQSPSDSNSSPENSPGNEILKEDEQVFDERKLTYNPGAWTPMEIETATGSAECTVMEHPLKLTSSYTEVKNSSGSRDANGEPLVTSYHRRFLGTVDYIWHSEGLQTARVLGPIPKHVMQQTRGFPTKKWGSDHIALVSEFAFVQEVSSKSTS